MIRNTCPACRQDQRVNCRLNPRKAPKINVAFLTQFRDSGLPYYDVGVLGFQEIWYFPLIGVPNVDLRI